MEEFGAGSFVALVGDDFSFTREGCDICRLRGQDFLVIRQRLIIVTEFEAESCAARVERGLIGVEFDQMRQIAERILRVIFAMLKVEPGLIVEAFVRLQRDRLGEVFQSSVLVSILEPRKSARRQQGRSPDFSSIAFE